MYKALETQLKNTQTKGKTLKELEVIIKEKNGLVKHEFLISPP